MTVVDREDLILETGDSGSVWYEVISILPAESEIPCDFCNHPINVAERESISADYVLKVGHSGAAYICDYCIDPSNH